MKTNNENKPHPHADLIKAWAEGAEIQYFNEHIGDCGEWRDVTNNTPLWDVTIQYRIKPGPEEPSNMPWKEGERYYFIDDECDILCEVWNDGIVGNNRYKNGNCFRTKEEAEAAIPRVKAALKGVFAEDINVPRNVGTNVGTNVGSPEIDGKTLTNGEKSLIRAFRNGRLCRQFSSGSSSLIVEGHDKVPCGVATHREFVAFFMHSPMQNSEVRVALSKIQAEQEANQ